MTAFTLPDDLVVEVLRPEYRRLTAAHVLAGHAALRGIWDGPDAAAQPQEPGLTFRIGWAREFAGRGFEDISRAAVYLAAHLVSGAAEFPGIPDWPGDAVHVRAWPVIDFHFQFEAGPEPVKAVPPRTFSELIGPFADGLEDQDLAARLRDAAEKAGMVPPGPVSVPAA